jgi:hypothetical protein
MLVTTARNAALAGGAFLAMILAFTAAGAAAPDDKTQAPAMTLISTDTSAPFPFAAIEVNHTVYHVTEGDVLDGVSIRHISPGRVTLSNDQVLTAGQPVRPDPSAGQDAAPREGAAHPTGR